MERLSWITRVGPKGNHRRPRKREAEGDLPHAEWREDTVTTHTELRVVRPPEAGRRVEWGLPRTSPACAPHSAPNTHVDFSPVMLSLDSGLQNGQSSVVLRQQVWGQLFQQPWDANRSAGAGAGAGTAAFVPGVSPAQPLLSLTTSPLPPPHPLSTSFSLLHEVGISFETVNASFSLRGKEKWGESQPVGGSSSLPAMLSSPRCPCPVRLPRGGGNQRHGAEAVPCPAPGCQHPWPAGQLQTLSL